jgi:hypothetical protein
VRSYDFISIQNVVPLGAPGTVKEGPGASLSLLQIEEVLVSALTIAKSLFLELAV